MKNKISAEYLLNGLELPFKKFHKGTKLKKIGKEKDYDFWPEEWKNVYYKAYSRFPEVKLPTPKDLDLGLSKALVNRKSDRKFSEKPLRISDIASLMYWSAGLNNNKSVNRRFYPSAGARYPLEIYLLSYNSELPNGIYHYYVKNNSLEKLFGFDKKSLKKITSLKWVSSAGCMIVITAVFKRNTIKYGNRGYRHVLAEAGHLSQNLYLVSSALNLGICGIGGYVDDYLNEILDVDGVSETVVGLLAVGQK